MLKRMCLGRLCMYFLYWWWRSAREQFPMERTRGLEWLEHL